MRPGLRRHVRRSSRNAVDVVLQRPLAWSRVSLVSSVNANDAVSPSRRARSSSKVDPLTLKPALGHEAYWGRLPVLYLSRPTPRSEGPEPIAIIDQPRPADASRLILNDRTDRPTGVHNASVAIFHQWRFVSAAESAPLTYDAALKLADQTAPSLQAKAAEVRAARSSAIAAGRLPDPKLEFGVEGFPVSGPLRRPSRARRLQRRACRADAGRDQQRQAAGGARARGGRHRGGGGRPGRGARDVRLNTALAWIDLYYAERRLAALDEIDRALAPLRTSAPSQLASGAMRPAQTLEPEQLTAALGDRRADLVAAVAKARAELVRWTDDAQAEVAGDPPDFTIDPVALRAGLDGLPSIAAYDAMGRQADADVDAAKADKRPDWTFELAYQHRDPRFGDMVMAQVTVSLPLFGATRQDPIIAARAETANRVRIEREAARRALVAQLDSDLADHAMHHDRLHRALETLVPLAKRRADLETASYAAGTASLSDALQAFLALAEARIDAIDREADVARDGARIVLTYGSDAQ